MLFIGSHDHANKYISLIITKYTAESFKYKLLQFVILYSKFMVDGKNRPFSAMDAYRYIIDNPRKPIGTDVYNTSYQHQRTEAWRQSAQSTLTSASSQPRNVAVACF